ncbi:hypothetical protein DFH28DRAFT_997921 [Melampsora americana]|nr:hypothetical protein DFH28DRAFT_997921 [Melampsora americana]
MSSTLQNSSGDRTTPALNPFTDQISMAKQIIDPQFPSWALNVLIIFAVMRGILMISCVAILIIPVIKGPISRKKHFFFFRRMYPEAWRGMPYLVPNRSMILVICELVSSALYFAAACDNYLVYSESAIGQGRSGYFLPLCWLPSYLGIVLASWSLCHACLCDVEGKKTNKLSRILTPNLYNSIWISWTILAISLTAYWTIRAVMILSKFKSLALDLFTSLEKAAEIYETRQSFDYHLATIFAKRDSVVQEVTKVGSVINGWAITWLCLAVVLAVFYLFTVQLLLRMLKQAFLMRESDAWVINAQWSSPIWIELEKEFSFLSKSSILVALSIFSQISELIYQTQSSVNLTNVDLRLGSALLTQLPGVFMTPALLFQSWRVFTERSAADESKFHQIPFDFKHQDIPQMTSQLLGWDTTVWWGKEISFEVVNFPGLCEVQSRYSKDKAGSTYKLAAQDVSSSDIGVVRTTVVTHESI